MIVVLFKIQAVDCVSTFTLVYFKKTITTGIQNACIYMMYLVGKVVSMLKALLYVMLEKFKRHFQHVEKCKLSKLIA